MKLLIDADFIVYKSCAAAENEVDFGNDVILVTSNFSDAYNATKRELTKIENKFGSLSTLILFFSDRVSDKKKKINFMSSVIIGISQAFAILPGISRSGSTIGTSIFLGIDREIAAKFSFLMVVPVILGSSLKLLVDNEINLEQDNLINYTSGFIAALISGYYACKWMIVFVKKSKLIYFSIYCLIVGILSIVVSNLYG